MKRMLQEAIYEKVVKKENTMNSDSVAFANANLMCASARSYLTRGVIYIQQTKLLSNLR